MLCSLMCFCACSLCLYNSLYYIGKITLTCSNPLVSDTHPTSTFTHYFLYSLAVPLLTLKPPSYNSFQQLFFNMHPHSHLRTFSPQLILPLPIPPSSPPSPVPLSLTPPSYTCNSSLHSFLFPSFLTCCSSHIHRTHSVIIVGASGEVSYTESTLTDFDSFSWDTKTVKFSLGDDPLGSNGSG